MKGQHRLRRTGAEMVYQERGHCMGTAFETLVHTCYANWLQSICLVTRLLLRSGEVVWTDESSLNGISEI